MTAITKTPIIYWIVAVIATLWNAMGCFNWFLEYNYFKNPDSRIALPENMRDLYDYTPEWSYIVFAIAVVTGLIGSILLLMKKKSAVPVLLISLVTVLILQLNFLFLSGALSDKGLSSIIVMPLVVIVFSVFIYFFARAWRDRGLLT